MDVSAIIEKALGGDVESLRQAHKKNTEELLSCARDRINNRSSNFIHTAVAANNFEFLSGALGILPQDLVLDLLCQTYSNGCNPFHCVAQNGNIFTLKLLASAYVKVVAAVEIPHTSPLLMKNSEGRTPLHCCFANTNEPHESVARHLVLVDHHLRKAFGEKKYQGQMSTSILDKDYRSVLFCAVQEGFSLLVMQILNTARTNYKWDGSLGETPLHYASRCNEQVAKQLLGNHPELIGRVTINGDTVLHRAVRDNAAWLVKLMLSGDEEGNQLPWNKACRRLIWYADSESSGCETPLHIAAKKGYVDIAKHIIQCYKSALQDEPSTEWLDDESYPAKCLMGHTPWLIRNAADDIPLFVALKSQHDDFGVYMLTMDTCSNIISLDDQESKSIHKLAIVNGCLQSAKMIFEKTACHRAENLLKFVSETRNADPGVVSIINRIAETFQRLKSNLSSLFLVFLISI